MELRHLRYFIAVAEQKSLGQAAQMLHISQPAVSRQIQNLEEELGVALFDRAPSGMLLTTPGEAALEQARSIVLQADQMVESMQSFDTGGRTTVLRIGYIATAMTLYLSAALRQLSHVSPHVSPIIREQTPSEQEADLRAGRLDLALLGHPRPEVMQEFRYELLAKVPLAALISSDHPLAHRKTITLSELIQSPFISLSERQFPTRPQMLADVFARAQLKPPKIAHKAEGISELLGLVGANVGVAILPEDAVEMNHNGVEFLKLRKPTYHLTTAAVWSKQSELEPEIMQLIGLMRGE